MLKGCVYLIYWAFFRSINWTCGQWKCTPFAWDFQMAFLHRIICWLLHNQMPFLCDRKCVIECVNVHTRAIFFHEKHLHENHFHEKWQPSNGLCSIHSRKQTNQFRFDAANVHNLSSRLFVLFAFCVVLYTIWLNNKLLGKCAEMFWYCCKFNS